MPLADSEGSRAPLKLAQAGAEKHFVGMEAGSRRRRCTALAAMASLLGVLVALAAGGGSAAAQGVPIPPILPPPEEGEETPPPTDGGGGDGDGGGGGNAVTVRTGTTGNHSELKRTIPIGGRAGSKARVVMSLPPGKLGGLRDGDRLEASAEVQVSVCLKPDPDHRSRRPCIGRVYGYDPSVSAKLILAGGDGATGGVVLGSDRLSCSQHQPARNHHCVLAITNGKLDVANAGKLPCDPQSCYLNLVLSAHDRRAAPGHRLVIGSDDEGRRVIRDKGRINFTRLRPGGQKPVEPIVSRVPLHRRISIANESSGSSPRAVYSVALPNVKAGEQIVVEGKLVTGIGSLPYNALQTTSIALSSKRTAAKGGVPENLTAVHGQISEANGFNCTQGRSAHRNPCVSRKVGVVEFLQSYHRTVYVNLAVEMRAMLLHGRGWKSGDNARVRPGYLRIWRYPASMNDDPPPAKD